MALSIGAVAPNFTLFNTEKKEISLANMKGQNVVLHFFPLAFTGVCTTQLCTLRDSMTIYNRLNCVVLGISIDTIFSLEEFKKQQNIHFDLLSDFNKEVIQAYDMYIPEFAFGMKGVSKRGAFVIDKTGIIQYAEETANPGVLPNFDAIMTCLNSL